MNLWLTIIDLVSYLVYFDYQRRHSVEFRRHIRKTARKHKEVQERNAQAEKAELLADIKTTLFKSLADDPLPSGLDDREQAFMAQVGQGEQLSSVPGQEINAALSFYRALCVYPNPADLLAIYQKTINGKIYEIVMTMIAVLPPQPVVAAVNENLSSKEDTTD